MTSNEFLQHLGSVSLFRACSDKELQAIARSVDEITLEEGRVLMTQGQTGHEAFVIVEGAARADISGEHVADFGPGDLVGALSVIDGGERTATITATTPLTVLVIHQPAFLGLMDEIPGLARKVMVNLAGIVRSLDQVVYP